MNALTLTEDMGIVERLFSSSLVAIVSLKAPRKLKVCHFKAAMEICNYSHSNTILAVKVNRQRLIVCLGESLYTYNIRENPHPPPQAQQSCVYCLSTMTNATWHTLAVPPSKKYRSLTLLT